MNGVQISWGCTAWCFSLLLGAADAFSLLIDLNTFTSEELAYAARHFTALDGTWTLTTNSWWNGSATLPHDSHWRAALAAIGSQQFSEEMWPCSEAEDAAWDCSDITVLGSMQSYGQCRSIRQLAPQGRLAGAFAYYETGAKPHTMLSWAQITEVSRACGGCKVLGHTRMYSGEWKPSVDAVLAHPQLLGIVFEHGTTQPAVPDLGIFAEAMLAAGKHPFFLLPFKAAGKEVTGMSADGQMRTFLQDVLSSVHNASVLDDPRMHIVIARYGSGLSYPKPPPYPPPTPISSPPPPPQSPRPEFFPAMCNSSCPQTFLPVGGGGDDTVAAAVAAALQARDKRAGIGAGGGGHTGAGAGAGGFGDGDDTVAEAIAAAMQAGDERTGTGAGGGGRTGAGAGAGAGAGGGGRATAMVGAALVPVAAGA